MPTLTLHVLPPSHPCMTAEAALKLKGLEYERVVMESGRHGDAIQTKISRGVSFEYIFDPETGELLAQRGTLVDPSKQTYLGEVPAGTVLSERDFVEEGGVGSTTETVGEAG